jgi:hypothetical protein
VRVVLVDQDPRALNRASVRNEGKNHLGFIYANDRSMETAFFQLEGALHFRQILARWTGSETSGSSRRRCSTSSHTIRLSRPKGLPGVRSLRDRRPCTAAGRGEFSADWPRLLHMILLGEFERTPVFSTSLPAG